MMLMLILLLLCRQFGEMTSGLTRLFAPLRMSGLRALTPWRGRGEAAAGRGEAAAAGRREAAAGAISRGGSSTSSH